MSGPSASPLLPAARIVNRYLCAERGLAERWQREEVERLVNEGCNEDMPYPPILALRGVLALERGQLRQALADANAAIKLAPTNANSSCTNT